MNAAFLTRTPAPEHKPKRPRAADLLEDFIASISGKETVTLAELMNVLGHRAFGVTMLVFALANLLIANIPGISTILGLPLILLSVQMMLGQPRPWLPKSLAERQFQRAPFVTMLRRAISVLRKIQKFITPRLLFLSDEKHERYVGFFTCLIAIVLSLPIVFGNWLPAWGLTLIAIGLIERDGLFMLVGGLFGVAALTYAIAFYSGFVYLLEMLWQ